MPPVAPPTEGELFALAERALGHAGGEGQVTAWWERTVQASGGAHLEHASTRVELLMVVDGRRGSAVAGSTSDEALRAAAARARDAAAAAQAPAHPLPAPWAGRAHAGFDPALIRLDPTELVADGRRWRAGAAKTAILSSHGVSAYEQRSFASLVIGAGTTIELSAAALSPSRLDVDGLIAEAAALAGGGEPTVLPAGELPVVLGPAAVAAVLDLLRPELAEGGGLADRLGTRVAASCVNLSDSPRYGSTLPRSYDALGAPRQPVPLIQDGVANRVVSSETGHTADSVSDVSRPEHLVLVGGGAAGVEELMAPIDRGLYLPSLEGGFEIVDGRRGRPLVPARARVDAMRVLATTQALTHRQRTVATDGTARTVGATVCPALRASGGVELEA